MQEKWEIVYGLKERAAENRINIAAASRASSVGGSCFVPLTSNFGMWRPDRAEPFNGVISAPDTVEPTSKTGVTIVELHPAEAVNRMVTRDTDLVDGRPWELLEPLVTGQQ